MSSGERILEELREQVRIAGGREPEPSAGIVDSQSVKGSDTVGLDSRGYDAGRKSTAASDSSSLIPSVCWS